MRKIRVAQIGTSRYSHGSEIFSAMRKLPGVFELVGYAMPECEDERFPEKMPDFEGYKKMTVEEILSDPTVEAVTVETEEIHLTDYAILAAKAGKHIHMEKPGGFNLRDFEELVKIQKESGKVFHTGYMYRYNPVISDIIKRVKEGEIGEVISVEAQMSGYNGEEHNEWIANLPGGMMFYLGCHLIDLVLTLQGKPEKVIAFNKTCGTFDTGASDFAFALFEYKNGVSFIKTTQAEHGGFDRRQLVISGTKGKFEVRPLEVSVGYPMQYTEYTECKSTDWDDRGAHKRSSEHDRYEAMMLDFAQLVRGEKDNPYTYGYELELFSTIKKCCE